MSEPLDIEALCDTIRYSMSADDRQTRADFEEACAALRTLRAAAEERDDLRQYLINAESKLERLRSRDRILSEIEKMPGRSSLYHHADGSWSLRTYETENGEGYKWRTIAKGTLTDVTEARRRAALDDKEDAQ